MGNICLAYDMFSLCKDLYVILFLFPPFGLWSWNFFLIAPFPDHCLILPFYFPAPNANDFLSEYIKQNHMFIMNANLVGLVLTRFARLGIDTPDVHCVICKIAVFLLYDSMLPDV